MGHWQHGGLQHHAPIHPHREKLLEPVAADSEERQADGSHRLRLALGTARRMEDQRHHQREEQRRHPGLPEERELARLRPVFGRLCAIHAYQRCGTGRHQHPERARLAGHLCRLPLVGIGDSRVCEDLRPHHQLQGDGPGDACLQRQLCQRLEQERRAARLRHLRRPPIRRHTVGLQEPCQERQGGVDDGIPHQLERGAVLQPQFRLLQRLLRLLPRHQHLHAGRLQRMGALCRQALLWHARRRTDGHVEWRGHQARIRDGPLRTLRHRHDTNRRQLRR